MKVHFDATVILDIELEIPKEYEEFYTDKNCEIWKREDEIEDWEVKAIFDECERICGDNLKDIIEC